MNGAVRSRACFGTANYANAWESPDASTPCCHYHLSVQVEILSTLLGQVARKDRTIPSLRETEFLDSRSNCDSQLHQDTEVTP